MDGQRNGPKRHDSSEVGVVLDLETPVAKIWLSRIELALSDLYASHAHFKTRLVLNIRDSKKDIVSAASAAEKIGMLGQGYVWIITKDFTNLLGSLSFSVIDSMQGVLGIKTFVPPSKELDSFKVGWKSKFYNSQLNVMGLWAYDSIHALALATEKHGSSSGVLNNVTSGGSTTDDLFSYKVSPIGPKLLETLSGTRFRGLAGDFILDNGTLKTSTFQIVNVVNGGRAGRKVGFWTQKNGLVRTLLDSRAEYSTSKSNLKHIIWPGESIIPPKGWVIPTNNGRRLRIGIPVITAYKEFVDVTNYDPSTNTSVDYAIGISIDVFKAAVKALTYDLSYYFFPYQKPNGSYDDLNYDAVVANTTIRANRSQYVDFTLPYTESGVAMVVPMRDNKTKSAWIFLKPLTWDLWVTTFCFFLFIGFVVWVLEHRVNEDFRGPPSHQIGTSFSFSFSTMERVVSNLARFVVIIWVFVVLILTQSYTASLASLLTVEKLQPTITDINQLLRNGERVGCFRNSFVYGLLEKTGFPSWQIVPLNSTDQCDHFLSIGSAKGGIFAYVDETPNTRIFLGQYCSKYTLIGPIFNTVGYGFVFPKGSPLVCDVSRAILNVTETEEMKKTENKWFETVMTH
ncbi:glutamate receptor 2.8-like [Humulus lupulus]|uniref:glutamate receptor 2.8-like n=1 Tax=Humulus lupulus TaxID=3486 RepID=UPI002B415EAD|nr:glutamate receptor 2.8-like [Humulus lupulus]